MKDYQNIIHNNWDDVLLCKSNCSATDSFAPIVNVLLLLILTVPTNLFA